MLEFCKQLPKVELHAHLNGSLSNDTLKRLQCHDKSIDTYHKLNNILDRNERTLDEVFSLFQVAYEVTDNQESVYLATESVINDFHDDNVVYLELRTTPRSGPNMSKSEYVESVIKAIQHTEKDIVVKLLLSIDRTHDAKTSEDAMDLIIEMKNKYPDVIKGVDLGGNPTKGHFPDHLFSKARENGLYVNLHCAEVKNDDEVLRMLHFRPDRLGHGTCIHPKFGGSHSTWELYCQLKIPVECCLTSNVICGTTKSYKEHHMREWFTCGLPFTIGTDDKGVFCTELSREYLLAHENIGLTKDDLWQVSYNSLDYSFASTGEKLKLKSVLDQWKNQHIK